MSFPFPGRPHLAQSSPEAAVAALSPASLFIASDLTSMFTTSDGATQVAADNEPVGLWLDKSRMGGLSAAQFLAGQPELVTNGGFGSDSDSGWTKGTGWSVSAGTAVATNVADGTSLTQSVFAAAGTYKVTMGVSEHISGAIAVFAPGYAADIQRGSAGSFQEFIPVSGAGALEIRARGLTSLRIDTVSVKAVPGDHVRQPAALQRPLFRTDGTHRWLQGDEADDYLAFSANPLVGAPAGYAVAAVALSAQPPVGSPGPGAPFGQFGADAGSSGADHSPWSDNVVYFGFGAVTRQSFAGYPSVGTAAHLLEAINDGATLAMRANGIQSGVNAPIGLQWGNAPLLLASQGGAQLYPYHGRLYGLVTFPRIPDNAEQTLIKQHLTSISPVAP